MIDLRRHPLTAEQLRAPENRPEEVVEVVRDAGRELAQRAELLGLDEPLPQPLGFRHVDEQALRRGEAVVFDAAPTQLQVANAALRVLAEDFRRPRALAAFPCGDAPTRQRRRRRVEDPESLVLGCMTSSSVMPNVSANARLMNLTLPF